MTAISFEDIVRPARDLFAAGDERGAVLAIVGALRPIAPRGMRLLLDDVASRARRNADAVATLDADDFEQMIDSAREAFEAHVRALSGKVLERMAAERDRAMPTATAPVVNAENAR